jgi:hypothetical protein
MYITKFMGLKRKGKFCHWTTKKIKSNAIDSKDFCEKNVKVVTTLTLGSRPKQGLEKVQAKSEPRGNISYSRECKTMWGNEPPHSQMSSHFGNWNPNRLPNLQKAISEVKTHWIEEFLISLEIF